MACTRLFRPCFFLGNNRLTVEKTFAGLEVFDNDALLSRQGKNSNKDLMSSYTERAEKIFSRVNEIAAITEEQGIMKHTYGCDAFIEAGKRVQLWMRLAGLETRIDNIGNFRGRWLCRTPNARTFIIASYVDSGINDRKFDGLSGVLTGLDVIENIVK